MQKALQKMMRVTEDSVRGVWGWLCGNKRCKLRCSSLMVRFRYTLFQIQLREMCTLIWRDIYNLTLQQFSHFELLAQRSYPGVPIALCTAMEGATLKSKSKK